MLDLKVTMKVKVITIWFFSINFRKRANDCMREHKQILYQGHHTAVISVLMSKLKAARFFGDLNPKQADRGPLGPQSYSNAYIFVIIYCRVLKFGDFVRNFVFFNVVNTQILHLLYFFCYLKKGVGVPGDPRGKSLFYVYKRAHVLIIRFELKR